MVSKYAVIKSTPLEIMPLGILVPKLQAELIDDPTLYIFDQLPEVLVSEYRGKRIPITSVTSQQKLSTGGYAQINQGQWNLMNVAIKYALAQGSRKDSTIVHSPRNCSFSRLFLFRV